MPERATLTAVCFAVIGGSLCVWNPRGYATVPALPTLVGAAGAAVLVVTALARGALRWSRVATWAAAGLGVAVVTALLSPAPVLGLLGAAGRTTGALTRGLWLVAFLAGLVAASTSTGRRLALRSVAVASWVVAMMTLLGRLGVGVVPDAATERSGGPLGSAAFTGGALVVLLAVNLACWTATEDRRWRLAHLLGTGVLTTALVTTGARAAWLGVVVAAPLAWRALPAERRPAPVTLLRLAAPIVVVAVAVLLVSGNAGRLTSIADSDGTAAGRVALWSGGVRALGDTLLVGTGPDQQGHVLPEHLADDFERRFDDRVVTDRAHNELLDTWLASGFLGLATLLGGWWAVARAVRAAAPDPVVGLLGAGLVAYVVHLMFNFSVAPVDLVVWAVAGLACASSSRPVLTGTRPVVLGAIAGAAMLVPLALDTRADMLLRAGIDAENSGRAELASRRYSDAWHTTPWQPQLAEVLARFAIRTGDGGAALATSADAAERSGGDPRWAELEALALVATGQGAEAEAILRDLIAADDHNSSLYEALGYAALTQGRTADARAAFERALELNPRRVTAQDALDDLPPA